MDFILVNLYFTYFDSEFVVQKQVFSTDKKKQKKQTCSEYELFQKPDPPMVPGSGSDILPDAQKKLCIDRKRTECKATFYFIHLCTNFIIVSVDGFNPPPPIIDKGKKHPIRSKVKQTSLWSILSHMPQSQAQNPIIDTKYLFYVHIFRRNMSFYRMEIKYFA